MDDVFTPIGVMISVIRIQSSIRALQSRIFSSFDPASSMAVLGHLLDASICLAHIDPEQLIPLNTSNNEQGQD